MHRVLNLPPDLGDLAEPLRGIVGYCLIKDPAQRPTAQQILFQLLGHAGAPPEPASQPSTMLTQGAEIAAAHTPPRLATPPPMATPPPPAAWPVAGAPAAGGWVPPPGPSPYGQEQAFQVGPGPVPNAGQRSGKGIGLLAGSAAAALVALILVGGFIFVQFAKKDDKDGSTTSEGRAGGTLTMVTYAPTNIDPSNGAWGADRTIAKQLFTGLVAVGADGSFQNKLAASVEPGEGCRTWTIRIRTGTTFSNGEPVNEKALIRGWTRAAQSQAGAAATYMSDIDGFQEVAKGGDFAERLKPPGDDGLQLRLTAPDCDFPKRLAEPVFYPLPSAAGKYDNAAYNDRPIGNGPFMVESYAKSQRLVLVRNPQWSFGGAKLDKVVVELTGSDSPRAVAGVQSGQYDWADLSGDAAATARTSSSAELLTRTSSGTNFLIPITDRGPMKSKEARQAVSLALDRKALSNSYSGGRYPPATGLMPEGIPGFKRTGVCPSCEAPDPAKAKALAAEAGLKPGAQIRILVRAGSSYAKWAVLVEQQLERTLGWRVDIVAKPSSDYTSALSANNVADLIALGWIADYPSGRSFLEPLLGGDQLPPKGSNYGRWRNGQFDLMMRTAKTSQNPQNALSSLQSAEKAALDDMALIPVWNLANIRLTSKRFVNLQIDFDGDPTLATAALR